MSSNKSNSPENQATSTHGARQRAVRCMPQVLLVALSFSGAKDFFLNLSSSSLRAEVRCSEPLPSKNATSTCPTGSFFQDEKCVAVPPSSADWSDSIHCADKGFVTSEAFRTVGRLGLIQSFCGVLSKIVSGPLIDNWGRKPVILLSIFGGLIQVITYTMYTWSPIHLAFLLIPGTALAGLCDAMDPALSATVADLSEPSVDGRSAAFAALEMVKIFSIVVSMTVGHYILRLDLESYTVVWALCSAFYALTLLLGCTILRETLRTSLAGSYKAMTPAKPADFDEGVQEDECKGCLCREDYAGVRNALYALESDTFFANVMALQFPITIASLGFTLAIWPFMITRLNYSQAVASWNAVIISAIQAVGIVLAPKLITARGPHFAYAVALTFLGLGAGVIGLCVLIHSSTASQVVFWLGIGTFSTGVGLAATALDTMISVRVASESQGTFFSFAQLIRACASGVGPPLSILSYEFDSSSWTQGHFCFIYAGCYIACVAWFSAACAVEHDNPEDIEESSDFEVASSLV